MKLSIPKPGQGSGAAGADGRSCRAGSRRAPAGRRSARTPPGRSADCAPAARPRRGIRRGARSRSDLEPARPQQCPQPALVNRAGRRGSPSSRIAWPSSVKQLEARVRTRARRSPRRRRTRAGVGSARTARYHSRSQWVWGTTQEPCPRFDCHAASLPAFGEPHGGLDAVAPDQVAERADQRADRGHAEPALGADRLDARLGARARRARTASARSSWRTAPERCRRPTTRGTPRGRSGCG